ncbi:phytanoyl-CoA dioxygenase family protein [Pseudoalteromonas ostreae]|uniref:phytanoyl-CoA dioxygenase family protein n=1 Tax=Pseudoalteromonas ostreae TaxID=2774154 RepID=UPI001B38D416|nr:phytanoyl-CoA dioxygenase family protein [Pseudoalteromonas ostreae]
MQTNLVVEQFDQQGFVLIKRVLKPSTLVKLQHSCDELVAYAKSQYLAGSPFDNIAVMQAADEPFVYRINKLFQFQPQFAYLLAQSELMSYVEAIIGEAILPSYESLVIKNSLDERGFDWHRDMAVRTQEPIVTVGVYLDDAIAQQGALAVIPQSHCSQASVCDLKRQLSNDQLKSVDVTANAGDVVIHHINTVHASGRQEGSAIRRTIYFEFRAVSHFMDNLGFPSEWIEKRQALMAHLNALNSDHIPNNLQLPNDFYATQVQIESAEYCIDFAS